MTTVPLHTQVPSPCFLSTLHIHLISPLHPPQGPLQASLLIRGHQYVTAAGVQTLNLATQQLTDGYHGPPVPGNARGSGPFTITVHSAPSIIDGKQHVSCTAGQLLVTRRDDGQLGMSSAPLITTAEHIGILAASELLAAGVVVDRPGKAGDSGKGGVGSSSGSGSGEVLGEVPSSPVVSFDAGQVGPAVSDA